VGGGGDILSQHLFGAGADHFNQEGAFGNQRWGEADDDRSELAQALDLAQATVQQAAGFVGRDMVIIESRQQVEQDIRLPERWCAFEQGQHLVTGEGTADENSFGGAVYIHRFLSQYLGNSIGLEAIAAVQHGDGALQGQFGGQA